MLDIAKSISMQTEVIEQFLTQKESGFVMTQDYLIYLQTETTERKNYRSDLYGLKRVIEDVGNIYERRHLLQLFLNNDFPSTPRYQFKFYSDATIKRLNSHIFNMDEQIARALIVHQLLGTRISDTLTLRMDCDCSFMSGTMQQRRTQDDGSRWIVWRSISFF